MPNSRARFFILKVVVLIIAVAVIGQLFNLQVMQGDYYKQQSTNRMSTNITIEAPRGDIVDRYGAQLVTNKVGYSIMLQSTGMKNQEFNAMLKNLIDVLYESGIQVKDTFPVSYSPYRLMFNDDNGDGSNEDEKMAWFDSNSHTGKKFDTSAGGEQLIAAYQQIYDISDEYDATAVREIIGIRYEAEKFGFSAVTPFTLAEDVGVDVITKIKERQNEFKGVSIANSYVREYEKPGLASHILGRTGKISQEEYEANKEKDYGFNDMIGKQGIEKYAEDYLRGQSGLTSTKKTVNGEEVVVDEGKKAVPGNYVVLTIDSDLQKTLEDSLESNILNIAATAPSEKEGADANAGAAAVIDVNSGDVLAMASYPTFDLSTFDEDYESLIENDANPMWDRAVSGTYSPGSVFKMLSATAALQEGFLTPDEIIVDEGVYKFYDDYQPACWIWNSYKMTHGPINVSQALEVSCNYFFYEIGQRMGIDVMDEYAKKFGLGEYTGIELKEEAKGNMASPEYKRKIITNVTSRDWYGGDTLQAAIGQSYSLFTPIQLANYVATIANGGNRYKVNLIKSIRSSVDGSVVMENGPQVQEKIDMTSENYNAIKEGMASVVEEGGTASRLFQNYGIKIAGKTGTAQLGKGSDNATFVAFAPYDAPQIAIAVVVEHGAHGTNSANVARDIFDKYFNLNAIPATDAAAQPQAEAQPQ